MTGDQQRYDDELRRCDLLGAEISGLDLGQLASNDARYHRARARVLREIGMEPTVAFLREEALAALAGISRTGAMERWVVLHRLERDRAVRLSEVVFNAMDLMNEGVQRLLVAGAADAVAEMVRERRAQEARHLATLSCDWCRDGGGCNGVCY